MDAEERAAAAKALAAKINQGLKPPVPLFGQPAKAKPPVPTFGGPPTPAPVSLEDDALAKVCLLCRSAVGCGSLGWVITVRARTRPPRPQPASTLSLGTKVVRAHDTRFAQICRPATYQRELCGPRLARKSHSCLVFCDRSGQRDRGEGQADAAGVHHGRAHHERARGAHTPQTLTRDFLICWISPRDPGH